MKITLIAENNYKSKTAEERAAAITKVVEKMISRKYEQATVNK